MKYVCLARTARVLAAVDEGTFKDFVNSFVTPITNALLWLLPLIGLIAVIYAIIRWLMKDEMERIYTFTANMPHILSTLWPEAYDMKLESGNMHITLTSQDNGNANKTVTMQADANTAAVILLLDRDGNIIDRKQIVATVG